MNIFANMWVGKRFRAKIEVEEGRNKIKFVEPIPTTTIENFLLEEKPEEPKEP